MASHNNPIRVPLWDEAARAFTDARRYRQAPSGEQVTAAFIENRGLLYVHNTSVRCSCRLET